LLIQADSEHEAGETNGDAQSSDGTSGIVEEVIPVEDRSASQDQSSVQEEPPDELQLVQKMKISQLFVVPPENVIGLVSLTCSK
jgi:hypothetical protein